MSGKKPVIKKELRHNENTRGKIQATQLIKRLTSHAMGELKKPMDSTQVTAALGLLKKSLPDLSATDVKGDIFNHHFVVNSEALTEDEWTNQYSDSMATPAGTSESIN